MRFSSLGGRSIICREATKASAVSVKSLPQPLQKAGLCFITSSTLLLHSNVVPSCPGWPPIFLSVFSRRLWFFLTRFSSFDGGIWLLLLFFLFLSRLICVPKFFT